MNIVDRYVCSQKGFTDLILQDEVVSKLLLRIYATISNENKMLKMKKDLFENDECLIQPKTCLGPKW